MNGLHKRAHFRQAVLLGNPDTKRTHYLYEAAEQEGLPLAFLDWQDFEDSSQSDAGKMNANKESTGWQSFISGDEKLEYFLKIDPPLWNSCFLEELDILAGNYKKQLEKLAGLAQTNKIEYLNHPFAIAELLNKRSCKRKLVQSGIPVTEEISAKTEKIITVKGLLEIMQERRIYQVFLKPVNGSGAAGVSAFRWQKASGRMALYTCAMIQPGIGLVNTKRLRCFMDTQEVLALLDQILRLDCIVERWYAKADYNGHSYDLRAVMQDGRMDFLLARLSRGPITNLHLNNHPLPAAELGFSSAILENITDLCQKAMRCFNGLRSAGIDILLEKGGRNPRIIEMNAQGDLIYNDIFHANIIYRHQADIMQKWCGSVRGI